MIKRQWVVQYLCSVYCLRDVIVTYRTIATSLVHILVRVFVLDLT